MKGLKAALPLGGAIVLAWSPASAEFLRVAGDGDCGPDASLATLAEVEADPAGACAALDELDVARLAGGGSIDGPGLGCGVRASDERALEASLCVAALPGAPQFADLLTRAHNAWRAVVGLPPVVWSESVAEAAEAYADELAAQDSCPLVHDSGHAGVLVSFAAEGEQPQAYTGCEPTDQVDGLCPCTPNGVTPDGTFCVSDGENLFKASAFVLFDGEGNTTRLVQDIDGGDVTNSWGGEKRDYALPTDSCAPGAVCGHYTQVVWAATQQLGCGRALCADNAQIWACRYRPAGNFGVPPYVASEDDFEVVGSPGTELEFAL